MTFRKPNQPRGEDPPGKLTLSSPLFGSTRLNRGKVLDRNPHQLWKRIHAELGFQLSAGGGHSRTAHMYVLGDRPVWLAFGKELQRLQLSHR